MPCEQKLPNGQPCPHPAIFHCSECRIGLCDPHTFECDTCNLFLCSDCLPEHRRKHLEQENRLKERA
jgi:hypothetical protein